jgi:hypothetical protein
MSDNTLVNDNAGSNEGTAASTTNTTSEGVAKTFTQDEVNEIVQRRLTQVQKKFGEVDLDEYRELKELRNKQEQATLLKREKFDEVLQQVKSASDAQINKLKNELHAIKVDGSLISAASSKKSVAPDKVAALLKSSVRLADDGSVEVLDDKGQARYNPLTAAPLTVEELVDEFLHANPFFVQAGPSGTGSQSNRQTTSDKGTLDISSLDMKNPEHRKVYAEYRKKVGIV